MSPSFWVLRAPFTREYQRIDGFWLPWRDETHSLCRVGAPCAVCELPVTRQQMEFEIQFARDNPAGLDKYHVHTRCFAAWELERGL